MCRFKSTHKDSNRISLPDLYDLLTQGSQMGVENVFFGITAEPIQYGDLSSALKESKRLGFKQVGITTSLNSGSLNKDLIVSLSMVDEIGISIDAASKATYEYIRKGASWDSLISNLNSFGEYWNGNKVVAKFAIQKGNIPEISMFVNFVSNFPFFKAITYEPVSSSFISDENRRMIEWDYDDLLLCENELPKGYKKAKECGLECKEYITVAAIAGNKRILLDKGYKLFMERCIQDLYDKRFPISNPCFLPSRTLYISSSGGAYICECAYKADEFLLGDLNKQSLEKIWESSVARQLRMQLAGGIRPNLCKNHCYCFDGQMDARGYY
jgi:MoaA/NifB/PqqE/SkfB family radical SAM enzyme